MVPNKPQGVLRGRERDRKMYRGEDKMFEDDMVRFKGGLVWG